MGWQFYFIFPAELVFHSVYTNLPQTNVKSGSMSTKQPLILKRVDRYRYERYCNKVDNNANYKN